MFLQLTSGGSSVDMDKTLIVYSAPTITPTELTTMVLMQMSTYFKITDKI